MRTLVRLYNSINNTMLEKAGKSSEKLYLEHTHMKMYWVQHQSSPVVASLSSGTKISPAVLFIIVILAVLFFVSGFLHLLVRFLMKHPSSSSQSNDRYPEVSTSDALQRQLQQLFHLHDSGLDQAFIDALPVFMYNEIVGVTKEPFDCPVCLGEFSENDQLRLLPLCGHAFHINCIDTWLLSNSTCPLCRGALFAPGLSIENPMFDYDDFRHDDGFLDNGGNMFVARQKTMAIEEAGKVKEKGKGKGKGVLPVRLGKFRKMDNSDKVVDVGETSSSNLDARRCYSMGSYQYVVGDTSLKVALNDDRSKFDMKLVKGLESNTDAATDGDMDGKKLTLGSRTDSYSVSKIWLWSKKGKFASSSDSQ